MKAMEKIKRIENESLGGGERTASVEKVKWQQLGKTSSQGSRKLRHFV